MKSTSTVRKIILAGLIFLMTGILGCGGAKDATQRRNLMIPKKDELPKNKKYNGVKKRKTYKVNKSKKKVGKKKY